MELLRYTHPHPRVIGCQAVGPGDEVRVPPDAAERLVTAGLAVRMAAPPRPRRKATPTERKDRS